MPIAIRLFVLAAVVGGTIAVAAHRGGGDHPGSASAPDRSFAELTRDGEWSVITYALTADDAIVIRLRDGEQHDCNFKVHVGPRRADERIQFGIEIDHDIVPRGEWNDTVRRLGQDCAGYWYSTD